MEHDSSHQTTLSQEPLSPQPPHGPVIFMRVNYETKMFSPTPLHPKLLCFALYLVWLADKQTYLKFVTILLLYFVI